MKLKERKDWIDKKYKVIDMDGNIIETFEYYNSAMRYAKENGLSTNELKVEKVE